MKSKTRTFHWMKNCWKTLTDPLLRPRLQRPVIKSYSNWLECEEKRTCWGALVYPLKNKKKSFNFWSRDFRAIIVINIFRLGFNRVLNFAWYPMILKCFNNFDNIWSILLIWIESIIHFAIFAKSKYSDYLLGRVTRLSATEMSLISICLISLSGISWHGLLDSMEIWTWYTWLDQILG